MKVFIIITVLLGAFLGRPESLERLSLMILASLLPSERNSE